MQPILIECDDAIVVNKWVWKATQAFLLGHKSDCVCDQCRMILDGTHKSAERFASFDLSIEDARKFRSRCLVDDWAGGRRLVYLGLIERMSAGAADVLLKVLEDTPEHLQILVGVRGRWLMPATIMSRCVIKVLKSETVQVVSAKPIDLVEFKSVKRADKERILNDFVSGGTDFDSIDMRQVIQRKRRNLDLIAAKVLLKRM